MKTLIATTLVVMLFAGCSLVKPRELSPETRAQLYDHVMHLPSHGNGI